MNSNLIITMLVSETFFEQNLRVNKNRTIYMNSLTVYNIVR